MPPRLAGLLIEMASVTRDSVPTPQARLRLERLDDELLVYDAETARTIYLNPTASMIWTLCDGRRAVREIVELLTEAFPEDGAAIENDVEETLRRFASEGAIRFA